MYIYNYIHTLHTYLCVFSPFQHIQPAPANLPRKGPAFLQLGAVLP